MLYDDVLAGSQVSQLLAGLGTLIADAGLYKGAARGGMGLHVDGQILGLAAGCCSRRQCDSA